MSTSSARLLGGTVGLSRIFLGWVEGCECYPLIVVMLVYGGLGIYGVLSRVFPSFDCGIGVSSVPLLKLYLL